LLQYRRRYCRDGEVDGDREEDGDGDGDGKRGMRPERGRGGDREINECTEELKINISSLMYWRKDARRTGFAA
jgi:hypothetical protein